MGKRSVSYTAEEMERLKERIASKVSFEQMLPEFPGRTAYGLKRKASDLGLLRRAKADQKTKAGHMKMFMRPVDPAETNNTCAQDKAQDDAFQVALALAIANGLESAPHGIVTEPGTFYPKLVRAESIIPRSSPAGDCADLGTVNRRTTETAA